MTSLKSLASMFERVPGAPPRLNWLVPTAEDLRQDYLGIFEWIDMGYIPPAFTLARSRSFGHAKRRGTLSQGDGVKWPSERSSRGRGLRYSWQSGYLESRTSPCVGRTLEDVSEQGAKGRDIMPRTPEIAEARRALLEKYLRGDLTQTARATGAITRHAQGCPTPLSFGQEQVWFLSQLTPGSPVFNESVTVHLPGPLDVAALEQSFNAIIRRHEAWRTSFPLVDGQPMQMIHPPSTLTLPVVDCDHLPEAERETECCAAGNRGCQNPL